MSALTATPTLQVGGLYIILFLTAAEGAFHWGLYHHTEQSGGWKYHIKQVGTQGWITDHGPTQGATKSFLLIGFIRIANISPSRASEVHPIVSQVPHAVSGVTCRTWTLSAVQALMNHGLVRCSSLQELEQEAKAFASPRCAR